MAEKKDPDVKYVRNENGFIHSVSPDHYDEVLQLTLGNGRKVLKPGWEDVSEATARKENPQLFGALDPNVVLNVKEMQDVKARREFEAEFGDPDAPKGE